MKLNTAIVITEKLAMCWFIREQVLENVVAPTLVGISIADAIQATRMVNLENLRASSTPGTLRLRATVAEHELPRLFAWAVLDRQDTVLAGRR